MKRYICNTTGTNVEEHDIDVAVIGSGLAGMYTAYHLGPFINLRNIYKGQYRNEFIIPCPGWYSRRYGKR